MRNNPHRHQGNNRNPADQAIQTINQIDCIGNRNDPNDC